MGVEPVFGPGRGEQDPVTSCRPRKLQPIYTAAAATAEISSMATSFTVRERKVVFLAKLIPLSPDGADELGIGGVRFQLFP